MQLADTAGLRAADDELESAGVALAEAALAEADLVILVSDATSEADADFDIASRIPAMARLIRAWNKIDLVPPTSAWSQFASAIRNPKRVYPPQRRSAICKCPHRRRNRRTDGCDQQVARTRRPPAGAAVPFTAEQIAGLDACSHGNRRRDASAAEAALKALLADGG